MRRLIPAGCTALLLAGCGGDDLTARDCALTYTGGPHDRGSGNGGGGMPSIAKAVALHRLQMPDDPPQHGDTYALLAGPYPLVRQESADRWTVYRLEHHPRYGWTAFRVVSGPLGCPPDDPAHDVPGRPLAVPGGRTVEHEFCAGVTTLRKPGHHPTPVQAVNRYLPRRWKPHDSSLRRPGRDRAVVRTHYQARPGVFDVRRDAAGWFIAGFDHGGCARVAREFARPGEPVEVTGTPLRVMFGRGGR